ncbi:MAG TPA: ribonuclease Z [Trebonia sp.]|nr:ribonuclease Z [Trebonia sp.]
MSNRELVVLGTASQSPTRTRNHNGYFLRWDAEGILFDPGEGTQRQMLFAGVTATQVNRICVTHFHGDHCLGLPGLIQRISLDQVAHEVDVCFPAEGDGEAIFRNLRYATLYHDRARISTHPIEGNGLVAATKEFTLEARRLDHLVPAFGYRLSEPDGRRMLRGRLAAKGIEGPDIGRLQRDGWITTAAGQTVTLDEVSVPRAGQKFAFVMDTRLCDAAFELADHADMLVCESTFADADAGIASEYGHLTAGQAGRIAHEAGVRTLVLTHFSQRYESDNGKIMVDEAAATFGGVIVSARDLQRVPVPRRAGTSAG